jgi:hypothetical protein
MAHPEDMNDLPPESRPVPPPNPDATPTSAMPVSQGGAPVTGQTTGQAGETPAAQRFRDRLWSFRAVIAVALASVIVGGLGGAALANVSNNDDVRFGPGHARFQRGGPGMPPGMMNDRRQDRLRQWQHRRGMGQRQWGQDGPPGVPPSRRPSPPTPSSSG